MYTKYYPLIVKMHADNAKNEIALKNLNVLCDIEFILGFLYILPFLETFNAYIDQSRDVFIYNYVDVIKLVQ